MRFIYFLKKAAWSLKFSKLKPKAGLSLVMLITFSISLAGCDQGVEPQDNQVTENAKKVPDYWPTLKYPQRAEPEIEAKIVALLSSMTLEQKVAQMIQPEIRDITVEDMRQYGFGSYLNGGGAFPNDDKHALAEDWVKLADDMYQASVDDSLDGSSIPTMWGTDAVHGHNNVIGATLFPHNIGLGATRNSKLISQIAAITAREVAVTGIDWVFAPTVAVVRDDRWGRTYEGYSEDPEIVKAYSKAVVSGLQGGLNEDFLGAQRVIATVKHFLGDGGTEQGDDQGDNLSSERELFDLHAQGYVSGLDAGAQTVMVSFNSWHGEKNHGSRYLLNDVLKDQMGFDGLVVGDWNGHGQIPGCSNESCSQSINAGLDIFMVPTDAWKPLYYNTIEQVKTGEIPIARIDDAVARILRVKFRAKLFEKPRPAERELSAKTDIIGSKAHRLVAQQAVRESLVLLKNKNQLLPLNPKQKFGIAGDGADNIGKQSGGWSMTWQGTGNTNQDFPGATSIYQGLKNKIESAGGQAELNAMGEFKVQPDVAIVIIGEEPYAEGNGDLANLNYQRGHKKDLELLKRLVAKGIPVVSVFISGRPLWVNPEINASNAFVAAWLPGTEGAGIADVLLTKQDGQIDYDFVGALSFSWPNNPDQSRLNRNDANYQPLLPYGFGLRYGDQGPLDQALNETISKDNTNLANLNLLQYPWNFSLQTGDELKRVNSSAIDTGLIRYRTIDRQIQEDARQIEFAGIQTSKIEINDNFPFDLRNYLDSDASLYFDIKIDKAFNQPMLISMRCDNDCSRKLAINSLFSNNQSMDWQTIKISLSCFKRKGQSLDKVFAPFVLETSENISIKLSEISIKPSQVKSKSVECIE